MKTILELYNLTLYLALVEGVASRRSRSNLPVLVRRKVELMEPMKPMKPMAPMKPMEPMKPMPREAWWPADLGKPSSTGAQNSLRYAFFPEAKRLVTERNGTVTVYDSAEHKISGVSQQHGHDQTVSFTSQHGLVDLDTLTRL